MIGSNDEYDADEIFVEDDSIVVDEDDDIDKDEAEELDFQNKAGAGYESLAHDVDEVSDIWE